MNVKIKPQQVRFEAAKFKDISKVLSEASNEINSASKNLGASSIGSLTIKDSLTGYSSVINVTRKNINELGTALQAISREYYNAEKNILSKFELEISWKDKINPGVISAITDEKIDYKDIHNYEDFEKYLYQNCDEETAKTIIMLMAEMGGLGGLDFKNMKVDILYSGTTSEKGERSASAGVLKISIPGNEKGKMYTALSLEVGTASAGALGSATLQEGVKGSASAGAKAFNMRIDRRDGTKYNNFHYSLEVNALDTEIYANGGLTYEDGLTFGAGARADVGSVTATGGFTVAGITVDAEAGVHYGAVAEVSGKIGPDGVGLKGALGLGGGVGGGFEIDASKFDDFIRSKTGYRGYTAGGGGYASGGGGGGAFGGGGRAG